MTKYQASEQIAIIAGRHRPRRRLFVAIIANFNLSPRRPNSLSNFNSIYILHNIDHNPTQTHTLSVSPEQHRPPKPPRGHATMSRLNQLLFGCHAIPQKPPCAIAIVVFVCKQTKFEAFFRKIRRGSRFFGDRLLQNVASLNARSFTTCALR